MIRNVPSKHSATHRHLQSKDLSSQYDLTNLFSISGIKKNMHYKTTNFDTDSEVFSIFLLKGLRNHLELSPKVCLTLIPKLTCLPNMQFWPCGGIGRRAGLKIQCPQGRGSSILPGATIYRTNGSVILNF